MKTTIILLLVAFSLTASAQKGTTFQQRDSLIKAKIDRMKNSQQKISVVDSIHRIKKRRENMAKHISSTVNYDSVKKAFIPIYDSAVGVITYQDELGARQTDTCIVYVKADDMFLVNDVMRKVEAYKSFRVDAYTVAIPKIKVADVVRLRNNKTINKQRILTYTILPDSISDIRKKHKIKSA